MPRRVTPFRQFGPRIEPGRMEPSNGGFDAPEIPDGEGPGASRHDGGGERPLSVSALSARITGALDHIGSVVVQGELSQAKVHGSGHFYATLKDDAATISVVMWRSAVQRHGRMPGEGEQVVVRGQVTTYPPRGQYQLSATRITAIGAGDLAARFEALKARLLAEGLFDEGRKRPLPFLPRAVGIATAAGSAALADLEDSILTRFPGMPIVHVPCVVQGPEAAPSVARALAELARHPQVDVIICGRGGGSLEDLWAFNEEVVVRAIVASPVPVMSAVGHETDTTLADFAADLRAKTPTAAGEIVVPDRDELDERLDAWHEDLDNAIDAAMESAEAQLEAFAAHRALAGPQYQVELRQQRLDELAGRLDERMDAHLLDLRTRLLTARASLRGHRPARLVATANDRLVAHASRIARAVSVRREQAEQRIAALAGRLDALSPLAVIARGYAVVRTPDGRVVRQLADAQPGARIAARVGDGWLDATVDGQRRQRLNEPNDLYDA